MIDKLLSAIFDEQYQFSDIWQLKLVKFDTEISSNLKHYQKNIAVSNLIEDVKGNPGIRGSFYLTNLRLIWHACHDKQVNLSIGLDTINNVILKDQSIPGHNEVKHIMIIKSMNPSQTRYEFKFSSFREPERKIFLRVQQTYKQIISTKMLRNIDTNIKFVNQSITTLPQEQIKSQYDKCFFYENEIKNKVKLILTNVRMIIINQISDRNYGIPWIVIESFEKDQIDQKAALRVKIRGILKNVETYIAANIPDFSKIKRQIESYSETYNKSPIIGIDQSVLDFSKDKEYEIREKMSQIIEIEESKVNIGRRKNAYGDQNQKGALENCQFNQQLGIMVEKMPQGVTRGDLWQILRN